MKTLTNSLLVQLSVVLLLSQANSAQALQCHSFTGVDIGPAKPIHLKVQRRAEKFAKKRQKSKSVLEIRKLFYKAMTQLLLKRNLGTNRVSEESTRDVYNETVTKVRALLGQTLITDIEITKLSDEIKKDHIQLKEFLNSKDKVQEEIDFLKTELAYLGDHGPGAESRSVLLSESDKKALSKSKESKRVALELMQKDSLALDEKHESQKNIIETKKEKLDERRRLKNELSKNLIADIRIYKELPGRTQELIDKIIIRGQRISILEKVSSLTLTNVLLPEFSEGKTILKTAKYDATRAREEIAFLKKQIQERLLKKQIRRLLDEQAGVHKRLVIYKDYFLDAQSNGPESFGLPKQKLLSSILSALDNIENLPGYKALQGFERKIFLEEFTEAFNFAKDGKNPKTIVLQKLSEQGGAVMSDFQEGIGAVKNSVFKKVRTAISALIISAAASGGLNVALPDGTGSVLNGTIDSGVSVVSDTTSLALFKLDGVLGFKSTATKLASVPGHERSAWLNHLVDQNGIDVTSQEGASVLRAIIDEARIIDLGEAEAAAEKTEIEAEKNRAIEELLEESE